MARNTQNIMSVNALEAAARVADIDSLYRVIEQDPHVLEHIDSIPFVETPLHVAASVGLPGHIQFAAEIMTLKPSFAVKLNPQGLTPIHLALENGHNRMALRLVDINKDLVRAKKRGGLTPLHLASQSGDIYLLRMFLKACPDSIEDITVTGETALHLAVKNNFDAFKFLVKWLKKKTLQLERSILNRKDEDGNTILHIAARNNAIELRAMQLLRSRLCPLQHGITLLCEEIRIVIANDRDRNRNIVAATYVADAIELLTTVTNFTMNLDVTNLTNQTAIQIAGSAYIMRTLVRVRGKVTRIRKIGSFFLFLTGWIFRQFHYRGPMSEENRNAYLVVATLVATATYQAALSPPGGFHQTDAIGSNNTFTHFASNSSIIEGKSIMSNMNFIMYSTTNMCAFLASTITIIGLLPRKVAWVLLYISTCLLIMSYGLSMWVISPNHFTRTFIAIIFVVLFYFFFIVMFGLRLSIG